MLAALKLGAIAGAVGLAAGLTIGASVQGWRLGAQLSKIEAAASKQDAAHRTKEREWGKSTLKIMEDSYAEAETLRAAVARADAAGRRVLDAGASHAAAAASAPGTSPAAAAAIRLHSELRREADDFAGEVAKHADAARAAGLLCERFDTVTR